MPSKTSITDCQYYARHYGGKCLSKTVQNRLELLKWKCEKGHVFENSFFNVKAGSWCAKCAKEKLKEERMEKCHEIARSKNGVCLSKTYVDSKSKIKLKCEKGHTWSTLVASILFGYWCPLCAQNRKIPIEVYEKIAIDRGGILLAKNISFQHQPAKWKCKKGHVFSLSPFLVRAKNKWCPVCRRETAIQEGSHYKYNIHDMQIIATKHGGECLSEVFAGTQSKIKWRCKNNHEFESLASEVIHGSWCDTCAHIEMGLKRRIPYEYYQNFAKVLKGSLLTSKKTFEKEFQHLKFKCKEGHIFIAKKTKIQSGRWCRKCMIAERKNRVYPPYSVYVELAKSRNGKLITPESDYKNNFSKLTWQCKRGHRWEAIARNVRFGKTWCPQCSVIENAKKQTIPFSEYLKLAAKRKGLLITADNGSINSKTRLIWQCAKGHQWKATLFDIRAGKWCKACEGKTAGSFQYHDRPTLLHQSYIESVAVAEKRKGTMLTPEKNYKGNGTKVSWKCEFGHRWEAEPERVKQGSWCKTCSHLKIGYYAYLIDTEKRNTRYKEFAQMAKHKNGILLTPMADYKHTRQLLRWKCENGHEWMAHSYSIQTGKWCLRCFRQKIGQYTYLRKT